MKIKMKRAQVYINENHKIVKVGPGVVAGFSAFIVTTTGIERIKSLPWRDTPEQAEADLMIYAAQRGWKLLNQQVIQPISEADHSVMEQKLCNAGIMPGYEGVELDIAMERTRENETNHQWAARQAGYRRG